MPRTIAVRHVNFEGLGILEPMLLERGHEIEYRDVGKDALDPAELAAADLLVFLGAPISSYDSEHFPFLDLEIEAARLRLNVRNPKPTLGICLGGQVMSIAVGAGASSTGHKEIGYAPVTLTPEGERSVLAELRGSPVLHWHGDQFGIPDGAERLAETAITANQAYAWGPNLLALQFHLEADYTLIERWLIGHIAEIEAAGIDVRTIRADALRYGPALQEAATRVFERWIDGWTA